MTYDPTPTEDEIRAWLRVLDALVGDAFEIEDEFSTWYAEARAVAAVAARTDRQLTQIEREFFVRDAIDTIDEHERALSLPADSGRTDAERIGRVLAVLAARGQNDASLGRALAALGSMGGARLVGSTSDAMASEGNLDPSASLATSFVITEADYLASRIRQGLALVLERALDASRLGTFDHASADRILATAEGARWGTDAALDGAPARLGRVTLRMDTGGSEDPSLWQNRARTLAPNGTLHADDVDLVMRLLGVQPAGDLRSTFAGTGDARTLFSRSQAASTTATVDARFDWRNRAVLVSWQEGTTDIRPGGAAEDGDGGRGGPVLRSLGAGGTGTGVTFGSGSILYADAGTGDLRLQTPAGATRYFNVIALGTSPMTGGTGAGHPFAALVGGSSLLGLGRAAWASYVAGARVWPESGRGHDAWATGEGGGMVSRCAMTPPMRSPAPGARVAHVLDTSIDWRNRFVLVSGAGWASSGPILPGMISSEDGATLDTLDSVDGSAYAWGHLGPGHGSGSTSAGQWDVPVTLSSGVTVHVFARSSDGALYVVAFNGAATPPNDVIVAALVVHGTARVSGATETTPDFSSDVDGDAIRPADWNTAQDFSVTGYARASDAATSDVEGVPLGFDVRGNPPIARAYHAHAERISGYVQDQGKRLVRRERSAGHARAIAVLTTAAGANETIEDTFDWRDRYAFVVRESTTSASLIGSFYTGRGEVEDQWSTSYPGSYAFLRVPSSSDAYLYVDRDTGALRVYNAGGSPLSMTLWIDASPVLGGRSVYVARNETIAANGSPLSTLGTLQSHLRADVHTPAGAGLASALSDLGALGGSLDAGSASTAQSYRVSKRRVLGAPPALVIDSPLVDGWGHTVAAASWAFLHNGDSTILLVAEFLSARDFDETAPSTTFTVFSTGTNPGMRILIDADTGKVSVVITNASIPWAGGESLESLLDGRVHAIIFRKTSSSCDLWIDGALVASYVGLLGSGVGTPPATPPRFGYRDPSTTTSNPGVYTYGAIALYEWAAWSTALSDVRIGQLMGYLRTVHGTLPREP